MVAGMLMPLQDLRAIYELLFRDGVMVAKKDTRPQTKHSEISAVSNLQVIRAMGSLKSRGYVKETFAWRHFYWYLTNDGIVYLRDYLRLPPEIIPASLQRVRKPAAIVPFPHRAARVQAVKGPTTFVPKPGQRSEAESQESLLERQGYRHKMIQPKEKESASDRAPRFRGHQLGVESVKPRGSWEIDDQAQPFGHGKLTSFSSSDEAMIKEKSQLKKVSHQSDASSEKPTTSQEKRLSEVQKEKIQKAVFIQDVSHSFLTSGVTASKMISEVPISKRDKQKSTNTNEMIPIKPSEMVTTSSVFMSSHTEVKQEKTKGSIQTRDPVSAEVVVAAETTAAKAKSQVETTHLVDHVTTSSEIAKPINIDISEKQAKGKVNDKSRKAEGIKATVEPKVDPVKAKKATKEIIVLENTKTLPESTTSKPIMSVEENPRALPENTTSKPVMSEGTTSKPTVFAKENTRSLPESTTFKSVISVDRNSNTQPESTMNMPVMSVVCNAKTLPESTISNPTVSVDEDTRTLPESTTSKLVMSVNENTKPLPARNTCKPITSVDLTRTPPESTTSNQTVSVNGNTKIPPESITSEPTTSFDLTRDPLESTTSKLTVSAEVVEEFSVIKVTQQPINTEVSSVNFSAECPTDELPPKNTTVSMSPVLEDKTSVVLSAPGTSAEVTKPIKEKITEVSVITERKTSDVKMTRDFKNEEEMSDEVCKVPDAKVPQLLQTGFSCPPLVHDVSTEMVIQPKQATEGSSNSKRKKKKSQTSKTIGAEKAPDTKVTLEKPSEGEASKEREDKTLQEITVITSEMTTNTLPVEKKNLEGDVDKNPTKEALTQAELVSTFEGASLPLDQSSAVPPVEFPDDAQRIKGVEESHTSKITQEHLSPKDGLKAKLPPSEAVISEKITVLEKKTTEVEIRKQGLSSGDKSPAPASQKEAVQPDPKTPTSAAKSAQETSKSKKKRKGKKQAEEPGLESIKTIPVHLNEAEPRPSTEVPPRPQTEVKHTSDVATALTDTNTPPQITPERMCMRGKHPQPEN
ncbi:mucin-5AC-like [Thalassophryne amazonica]|uniref:mucin-5AC-like n=1 Tax=Thalassophryne amazonica TaxID=390379 RepID=UPI001471FEAF|nr:mucin-5AC-like [Thalassophryne amazonica]